MIYLDTSIVIPLFLPQPETVVVETWFRELHEMPVSSDWLAVEFSSAIARNAREGKLRPAQITALRKAFDEFAAGGVRLSPIGRDAFADAAALVSTPAHGLRAGDALHLAAARALGADILATFDAILSHNAKRLGIQVVAPTLG